MDNLLFLKQHRKLSFQHCFLKSGSRSAASSTTFFQVTLEAELPALLFFKRHWKLSFQRSFLKSRAESSKVQACYRGFRRKRMRARFLSRRWKANSRRSAPCTCKLRSISVEGMSFGLSVRSSTAAARSSFSFGQLISRNGFGSPAK